MYEFYSDIKLWLLKQKIKYIEKDERMKGVVLKARLYSYRIDTLTRHKYDGNHYSFHTDLVYYFAKKYIHLVEDAEQDNVLSAAYTHDMIEDNGVTFNDVKKETNETIARLTSALTTYVHGHTREERAPKSYYVRIILEKNGDFLKVADRLANTYISMRGGKLSMGKKYAKEYPKFKQLLFRDELKPMFDELEEMYKKINK